MSYKHILIMILTIACLGSCEISFLDNNAYSDITKENHYTRLEDYESSLIGCYYYICGRGTKKEGNYAVGMPVFGEAGTDECWIKPKNNWDWSTQLDKYMINSSNIGCQEIWQNAYKCINSANEITSRIEKMSKDSLDNNPRYREIAGEASFLKALWYFNLARIFGGVPIREMPSHASENINDITRNSLEEVYAHINKLLFYAKEHLPATQAGAFGRATQLAAYGLSAKVNVHIASSMQLLNISESVKLGGINAFDWLLESKSKEETIKAYYTQGKEDAQFVLDYFAPNYLMPKFTDCFYPSESSREILFEGVMSSGLQIESGGWFGSLFGPGGKSTYGGGQHVVMPINAIVLDHFTFSAVKNQYSSTDDRFMWSISTFTLKKEEPENIVLSKIYKEAEIAKFRIDIDPPYNQDRTPVNNPILRVSDICLLYAEATAELDVLNGGIISDDAFKFLNIVRERALLPLHTLATIETTIPLKGKDGKVDGNREIKGYESTTPIEHFRRAILNERLLELIGEGHRWFDLVRMGLLQDVVNASTAYALDPNVKSKKLVIGRATAQDFHIYRPIPLREIAIHNGALKQNFGYN